MSPSATETADQVWSKLPAEGVGAPVPGVLLVFSAGKAELQPIPLEGGRLPIGRGRIGASVQTELVDACMSRRHAEVEWDGTAFTVRDLGSRNGTALDGLRLEGARRNEAARVLRTGDSLFLLSSDLRPYRRSATEVREGFVIGPTLRAAWDELESAARAAPCLHLHGESGTGKELAARAFHALGPSRDGPFVPVNCAAVPAALAERLFFGARRGAYSGADADADGYVQAADGGTLFLDEVAELDLAVQAKLLRFLESREVLAVGASKPRKVDVRVVSATHKQLHAEVEAGRFREDLFFRIARPQVSLPPLRARPEDIPWLIVHELHEQEAQLPAHASLVEACLLRAWPGNVRELATELRSACAAARAAGADSVQVRHLREMITRSIPPEVTPVRPGSLPPERRRGELPPRAQIEQALRAERGNVSRAAAQLGLHRTQLRRWLKRESLDPRTYGKG